MREHSTKEYTLEELFSKHVGKVLLNVHLKKNLSKKDRRALKLSAKQMAEHWARLKIDEIDKKEPFNFDSFYESNKDSIFEKSVKYAEKVGVPLRYVFGRSRNIEYTIPRHLMWFLMCKELGFFDPSYKAIGKVFNRDRGTIRSGVNGIKGLIDTNDSEVLKYLNVMTDETIPS